MNAELDHTILLKQTHKKRRRDADSEAMQGVGLGKRQPAFPPHENNREKSDTTAETARSASPHGQAVRLSVGVRWSPRQVHFLENVDACFSPTQYP